MVDFQNEHFIKLSNVPALMLSKYVNGDFLRQSI